VASGHLELVRWLLKQGARINFTLNGRNRCLPLLDAATNGHLEVVKFLIENGADVHSSFNGHTPLSQAVCYGHQEIAGYLQSIGAKA
jgi:ankyrin repeat protein